MMVMMLLIWQVPVSAVYARKGAPPTLTEHDAVAPWPLTRLALSGCDVLEEAVWYAISISRDLP